MVGVRRASRAGPPDNGGSLFIYPEPYEQTRLIVFHSSRRLFDSADVGRALTAGLGNRCENARRAAGQQHGARGLTRDAGAVFRTCNLIITATGCTRCFRNRGATRRGDYIRGRLVSGRRGDNLARNSRAAFVPRDSQVEMVRHGQTRWVEWLRFLTQKNLL